MENINDNWENRIAAVWEIADASQEIDLVAAIDTLAAVRADSDGVEDAAALFERASARDRVGLEAEAEKYYRAALALPGLDSYRRSRASIQLASTLRIVGQLAESEQLLTAELDRHLEPGNPRALHDEARAILALTFVAQGRAVEAAGLALSALSSHLTRYNRSVSRNAALLVKQAWD